MAEPAQSRKGPWTHRVLVHFFTVCLTVLIYWLLGFLMDDIRTWPGPDFATIETQLLDPRTVEQSKDLAVKMEETQRQIKDEGERQRILRESTQSSQETMRQLMEIQRLGLQKDVTPTAEEQKALADAETLFLTNQRRSQEINEKVATLDEQLRELQAQSRGAEVKLQAGRVEVQREFDLQMQRHDLKMAFISLAALSPFLALAAWLFFKHRTSLYSPMIYAYGLAVLLKIAAVMH
ncbi:MAG: hypothetical protein IT428_16000 [Planctomycetaceae bacterium]|nr:hypothetical protein [Planctomycetaceae bacterium]